MEVIQFGHFIDTTLHCFTCIGRLLIKVHNDVICILLRTSLCMCVCVCMLQYPEENEYSKVSFVMFVISHT